LLKEDPALLKIASMLRSACFACETASEPTNLPVAGSSATLSRRPHPVLESLWAVAEPVYTT
jgi:hypothetical protein